MLYLINSNYNRISVDQNIYSPSMLLGPVIIQVGHNILKRYRLKVHDLLQLRIKFFINFPILLLKINNYFLKCFQCQARKVQPTPR